MFRSFVFSILCLSFQRLWAVEADFSEPKQPAYRAALCRNAASNIAAHVLVRAAFDKISSQARAESLKKGQNSSTTNFTVGTFQAPTPGQLEAMNQRVNDLLRAIEELPDDLVVQMPEFFDGGYFYDRERGPWLYRNNSGVVIKGVATIAGMLGAMFIPALLSDAPRGSPEFQNAIELGLPCMLGAALVGCGSLFWRNDPLSRYLLSKNLLRTFIERHNSYVDRPHYPDLWIYQAETNSKGQLVDRFFFFDPETKTPQSFEILRRPKTQKDRDYQRRAQEEEEKRKIAAEAAALGLSEDVSGLSPGQIEEAFLLRNLSETTIGIVPNSAPSLLSRIFNGSPFRDPKGAFRVVVKVYWRGEATNVGTWFRNEGTGDLKDFSIRILLGETRFKKRGGYFVKLPEGVTRKNILEWTLAGRNKDSIDPRDFQRVPDSEIVP